MEPNLLVGDRLFVTKFSYGYSKHSFPFSPSIFKGRIVSKKPKRGDVIVFKTPADNRTDYIKRLIGMPGDRIQIIDSDLYINDIKVEKKRIENLFEISCGGNLIDVNFYEETLPNGKQYIAVQGGGSVILSASGMNVPELEGMQPGSTLFVFGLN